MCHPTLAIKFQRTKNVSCPLTLKGSIMWKASVTENFESCVWRAVSCHSFHHHQKVLLSQCGLCVHKGGLNPHSFHFIVLMVVIPNLDIAVKHVPSVHSVYLRPQSDTREAINAKNSLTYDQHNPLSPNTRHGASVGLKLGQYRRMSANIETKLFLVFAGIYIYIGFHQ